MAYKLKYDVYHEGVCGGVTCYAVLSWENSEEFNLIIKNIIDHNKESLIRHDEPTEEVSFGLHPWKILFWFSTSVGEINLDDVPKTLLDKYIHEE